MAMSGDPAALRLPSVEFEGQFNPAIFQPHWLASIGVLDEAAAEDAKPPVVTPEVALVRAPRLEVQITHRLAMLRGVGGLSTNELRDIAIRVFEQLPHSPISSVDMIQEAQLPPSVARWGNIS